MVLMIQHWPSKYKALSSKSQYLQTDKQKQKEMRNKVDLKDLAQKLQ
jgi:hypothetical protein